MVFFIVDDREFEVVNTKTMLEAKEYIMKELELTCLYIDIEFCLDRPMRVEGKFNIEPGKLSRTFDRYLLNQFAFKDKVTVIVNEVPDYDPHKPKKPFMSGGRGRGMSRGMSRGMGRGIGLTQPSQFNTNLNQMDMFNENKSAENTFDLTSNNDFPSLS